MKRTLIVVLTLLCAVYVQAQKSEQDNPVLERGLHPDKLYQFNDFDSVSVFNGNLGIQLPIGPSYSVSGGLSYQLALHHNSKFWDFDRSDTYSHAIPARSSNAGIGWTFGLGRFIEGGDQNGSEFAAYEAPDGGEHAFNKFYPNSTPAFTSDGTNLRLRRLSPSDVEIDFPDGVVQHHKRNADASWILTEIRAPRGTGKVRLEVLTPAPPKCGVSNEFAYAWLISDTEGRQTYACFKSYLLDDEPRAMVERIIFEPAPDHNTGMLYKLNYEEINDIAWVVGEEDPGDAEHELWRTKHEVQFLESLELPDQSTWQFEHRPLHPRIQAITLPTKARIEYEYNVTPSVVAPSRCPGPFPQRLSLESDSEGVVQRTVIPAAAPGATNERHVWTYDRQLRGNHFFQQNECDKPQHQWDEMVVSVTDPLGLRVESHFSMWTEDLGTISPAGFNSEHFSLPWGAYDAVQNRYLSQETKDCRTGPCKTLSITYVRHEIEPESFTHPTLRRYPIHRLQSQAVYDLGCSTDDNGNVTCPEDCVTAGVGPRCASTVTESSDWDGFAHYRVVTSSWDFGNGLQGSKTVTTNWNQNRVIIPVQPWVLDIFGTRTTTEAGQTLVEQACFALGTVSQRDENGTIHYLSAPGFLRGTRVLAGPTPGSTDLVTRYDLNPSDLNPGGEKYYGGDDRPLTPAASSATTACATLDALDAVSPTYATRRFWDKGMLVRAQHAATSFFSLDLDTHISGLATKSRDTAGAETSFAYDTAGRIQSITPPDGAPTNYTFTNAAATQIGDAWQLTQPATAAQRTASTSGALESQYEFDSLGRVRVEKKLLPDDNYASQVHTYDALGRKTSTTVWGVGTSLKKTVMAYDLLGRTTRVTAPDEGSVGFRYVGNSSKTRLDKIWNGTTDQDAETKEEYDGFGRLIKVTEPSGSNGAPITTVYTYGISDKLVAVHINGGVQPRSFTYDGRGFMTSESQPESGATSYTYDARGHIVARSAPDDNFDLNFTYDAAERPTIISGRVLGGSTFRPLKEFEYGTENGADDERKGKLWKATRFNYPVAGGPPTLSVRSDKITVTETYAYRRADGRLTERQTEIRSGDSAETLLSSFTQSTHFDELGLPDELVYPKCVGCGLPLRDSVTTTYKNGTVDTVDTLYRNGSLEQIDPVIQSTTYAPNGSWTIRKHSNGLDDVQALDPDGIPRPRQISVNVPAGCVLISTQPQGVSIAVGTSFTFTITSSESGATFQWYRGARGDTRAPVAGATTNILSLQSVTATSSYWCRVQTALCHEDSITATVNVCKLIAAEPSSVAVGEGDPASFSLTAYSSSAAFQWYRGLRGDESSPISGATSNILQIPSVSATASYWCRVTVGGCREDSQSVTATMCGSFAILQPAQDAGTTTAISGVELTFNVVASGDLLSYAWYQGTGASRVRIGTGTSVQVTPVLQQGVTGPLVISVDVTNGCTTQTRVVASLDVIELPACAATMILAPFDLVQTIMPYQQTILRAIMQLQSGVAGSYSNIQYRFQWYQDGALEQNHLSSGEGNGTALSEYLLRFETQSAVRLDATVICMDSAGHTVTSPVQSARSFGFQFGHCPVPDVISVPAAVVLREPNEEVTLTADSIYPWATFQWYVGESGNTDQTAFQGHLQTITVDAAGTYWVRAFSECGEHADSPTVTVSTASGSGSDSTFCTPVRIQTDPPDKSIRAFEPVTLTVNATSTPLPTSYVWSTFPNQNVPGGTATLTLNPGPRKTTDYAVRAGNACSFATSRYARVHVTSCNDMTIDVQPADLSIAAGDIASLTITATSVAPLRYQWYSGESGDTSNPLDAHGPTFNLGTPVATNRYWVRLSFDDATKCEVDSRTATVSVCATPQITNPPANRNSAFPGQDQTFSVGASGENLSYAWYKGSNTNDESQGPLSTTTGLLVYPHETTDYWVKVSSDCAPPHSDRNTKVSFKVSVCPDFLGDEIPTATSTLVPSGTTTTLSIDAQRGDIIEWYKIVGTAAAVKFTEGPALETVITPPITQQTTFYAVARSGNCSRQSGEITILICSTPTIHWAGGNPKQIAKGQQFFLVTGLAAGETANFKWYRGTTSGDVANSTLVSQSSNAFQLVLQSTASFWVRALNEQTGCYSDTPVHTVNVCVPTIGTQPQSQTINPGATATLSVTTDLAGMQYQWFRGAVGDTANPITGHSVVDQTSSITVTPSADTTYWVRVTGCTGAGLNPVTRDSQAAVITVCQVPAITTQPASTWMTTSSTPLSIVATGTELTYQWYKGLSGDTSLPQSSTSASFTVSPSQTTNYWVRVSGRCGSPQNSTAAKVSVKPNIGGQPAGGPITKGTTRALTVAANGTELTYQWYQRPPSGSPVPVAGATGGSYTPPPVMTDATYFARVYSGIAYDNSADATFTVCLPREINVVGYPSGHSGSQVVLQVINPAAEESFEWYRGPAGTTSDPIGGGTEKYLNPQVTTQYWVRTKRTGCDADSAVVTINICYPKMNTEPEATNLIASGTTKTLTVNVTGTAPLVYQWYRGVSGDTSTPVGTNSNVFTTPALTASTTYWVRISTNAAACATKWINSQSATVNVCQPPVITAQPQANTVNKNLSYTISVTATGDNLHYQWYIGDSGVTTTPVGTDSDQLPVVAGTTKKYWVRVTGACGVVDSIAALQSVRPIITSHPVDATVCGLGGMATFTVTATGADAYTWYRYTSGVQDIVGTTRTITIPVPNASATFRVVVSSGVATATSIWVGVNIIPVPTVTSFTATQETSTRWLLSAPTPGGQASIKYRFYEGALGDTSILLTDTTASYYRVYPSSRPKTYWVRVYFTDTGCATDRAVTIP